MLFFIRRPTGFVTIFFGTLSEAEMSPEIDTTGTTP